MQANPKYHKNGGLIETDLPGVKLKSRGKVRDIYDLGEHLLIVTSDRISAYDGVLPTPIPYKGVILNMMSVWWFEQLKKLIPNHLIAWKVDDYPEELHPFRSQLEGRSMLVKKCRPLDIEAIVRGYITGSGWADYQDTGMVCGHILPQGLLESARLDNPLFTPSTKAEQGEHDRNISLAEAGHLIGKDLANEVAERAIAIYSLARELAAKAGIIIADTKFEFGLDENGNLVLIDEVLTPDSSRFWPADDYAPGRSQKSYDKQFLRDWLIKVFGWDKKSAPPELPDNIVEGTRAGYIEAYERLTGENFDLAA